MLISDVIKAAIPGADESLCEYVLWERTHYPFAPLTAREIYRAANRFKRAADANKRLCDLCDRLATEGYLCDQCRSALRSNGLISRATDAAG